MANDVQMQFAKRLTLLRKSQGLTQQVVADILNVSRPAYAYYESGKAAPSLESLRRLVRLFCPTAPRYLLLLDELGVESRGAVRDKKSVKKQEMPLLAELTQQEQRILGMLRAMDEDRREEMERTILKELNKD